MGEVLFFFLFVCFCGIQAKKNNKLIKSTLCFSNLGSTRDSVKISHFKTSTISRGPHGGPALGATVGLTVTLESVAPPWPLKITPHP